jgi:hypothetical protein
MSVDQLPPGSARPAQRGARVVGYEQYIDQQIQTTRRLVKAVDVMTVLLVMTIGVLGILLAAAIVEHWLVPGGFNLGVRLLLFVVLVGGLSVYAARRLWPLCIGSINPAYAAQTIEHDNPSLKNSLLNLLLFRQNREIITDAVYETLEEQAAQRLTRVPVESAVDRTQLLRLGYVLMFVVAAAALYKVFSPKDPFVTAERVLMPWADIVPASRVTIENVEPGATTLARGEVLTVSADVRGIGEDDPVVVRYTTADGQAVDMPTPMKPSAAGLRFTGQIPPAEKGVFTGVAQDFRYWIEAGDARSREYAVSVVAAPTISIERIDYDYPDYTRFADHSVDRLGDIRAIEGTKVTIHARSNQPIHEAAVDFEADGRRDIVLNSTGNEAQTTFMLALRDDHQTPKFSSYVLRFTSDDGRSNRDPVKYPIDVLPDLPPETAILAPAEKVRDVRLDESVAIEVEARDPDFALAEVRLQGEAAGRKVIDAPLLASEHTGRYSGRLLFTPNEHGLQPGDVVRYWVTASDNRAPQPNEASSDSQTLRVVTPEPKQPGQPPQDRLAQREQREPQGGQGGEQQPGTEGQSGGESQSSQNGDQQQPGESAGESASADGKQAQADAQNSAQQSNDRPADEPGESKSNDNQSTNGQSSTGGQNGKAGDQQEQPVGADGARGQQQPETGGQQESTGTQRDRGNSGQSKPDDKSPVSPEGDNDGEAFDRIQKFLQREGKLSKKDQGQESGLGGSAGESAGEPASESSSADGRQASEQQSEDGKRNTDPNRDESAGSDSENQSTPNADSQREKPGAEANSLDASENSDEPPNEGDKSQSPPGQQTASKGDSGAGDQPRETLGSPDAQPNIKPADKWQQKPSGDKPGDGQEPPSGSHGKRESDSQGDQGGDRAGGGEEGGGQQANRDGTGGAGQNQSADEGAGESSEQGAGHDSPNAGKDATSNDRTGQTGSQEKGAGSAQRNGAGAPARADGEPASAGGQQPDGSKSDSGPNPTEQPTKGSQDSGASTAEGAGRVPNGTMQPTKSTGTAPDADAANLEYAHRETDLVLESLAEQMKRQQVDKRLLDELGWTEADLKRFLDRWQQLKAAARDDSPAANDAQRELDDALRSLGLRRGALEQSRVSDDALRNFRQGYRGAVPLEYQERLRAYNQGVSRARQDGE